MTYFLSFRTQDVGGPVADPRLYQGDGTASPLSLALVPDVLIPSIVGGRNLLFGAHGFNVSQTAGACSLGYLDQYLALGQQGSFSGMAQAGGVEGEPPISTSQDLFIGILWPGDCWLPVVDYPFEGGVAQDCGRRLAVFCNTRCANAQSLSFVSHSLGARLVLEAVSRLNVRAQSVCLTAAAINRDCLTTQYARAAANADSISILASEADWVLKVAFSIGDPFADLLNDDHTPFQAALGRKGPPTPAPPPIRAPWQTPDNPPGYGHGDYLPKCAPLPAPAGTLWLNAADFMKRSFLRQRQPWP
ncbi:MAG TPA: alpha/beta hydrolase [Alphaproteobacteria bacterium]|nr:alpha/beta hydrolase [Alphaproteobacteria bacterium]